MPSEENVSQYGAGIGEGEGLAKALIIAVSDYGNNLQSLEFCRKDGAEMYETLANLGYQIADNHRLIGHVKYESMRDAIIDFYTDPNTKAEDTLLFYYSGHGIPDVDGDMYFASSELNPDVPNRRGFSFNELTKMIQRSVSIRVVTMLDCCYSGAAKLSKGHEDFAAKLGTVTIDKKARNLQQGEGRCLLAASQAFQEAYALTEGDHSIFTYYLLEGLKGNQKAVDINGCVTPYSLGNYVYRSIVNLPPDKRPKQKPQVKAEASGDIILAYYPELARVIPGEEKQKQQGAISLSPSSVPVTSKSEESPELVSNERTSEVVPPSSDYQEEQYVPASSLNEGNEHPRDQQPPYFEGQPVAPPYEEPTAEMVHHPRSKAKIVAIAVLSIIGILSALYIIGDPSDPLNLDQLTTAPENPQESVTSDIGQYQNNSESSSAPSVSDQSQAVEDNGVGSMQEFWSQTEPVKLQYPSDWTFDEYTDGSQPFVTFFPQQQDGSVSIMRQPSDGQSLGQWLNTVTDIYDDTNNFNQIESSENAELAGRDAYKLVFTAQNEDGTEFKTMETGTIVGDNVYLIIYTAMESYSDNLPKVEQMIDSFEITQ